VFGDSTIDEIAGPATDEELRQIRLSQGSLLWPMRFYDPRADNIFQIRHRIRRARSWLNQQVGAEAFLLVILDGLHLVPGAGEGNRVAELTTISRNLKISARTDVGLGAIIANHQMNYVFYSQGSSNGMRNYSLRNLRDSGSIGQDADVVLFYDRPSVFNQDSSYAPVTADWENDVSVIAKKNRQTSNLFVAPLSMSRVTMEVKDRNVQTY
jgi:replicative DNA helicase